MGKKNKNRPPNAPGPTQPVAQTRPLISKRGWKVIAGGVFLLIIGYFVLSMADPMGQNMASNISPFLILSGYALIGVGIVLKDPEIIPVK